MKKDFLLIATAATMLTACVNLDTLNGVDDYEAPGAIGFSTLTSYQTKAAENSSATVKHSLGTYHQSFQVWSSKTVNGTPSVVFTAQKVNATLNTAAELYDADGAIAENATLTGALNSSDELTADQATAYNTAMSPETAKVEGNTLSADEAAAYNATLTGAVAAGDIKTEAVYDWTYSPLVFWDKSATKYDFYAAAPADLGWVWDNENKKLSLDNFSVDGAPIAASATVDPKAVFGANDIMISEDITNYTSFKSFTASTKEPVNLSLIHLLSRLNIGIKKATPLLDDYIVNLKSIKIYKMKSNGKFNEGQEITHNTLATGTYDRWIAPTNAQTYYDGVGYETSTVVTTSLNYVYQALAIPQEIVYQSLELNGSDAASSENAYLTIEYDIWNKAVEQVVWSAEDAKEYNAALEGALNSTDELTLDQANAYNTALGLSYPSTKAAGDHLSDAQAATYNATLPGAVAEGDEITPAVASRKLDDYSYTYNLADAFNGDGATTNVAFNEGWMNTLNITINPIAIEFDAVVYEWAPTTPVDIDVPDINTPQP